MKILYIAVHHHIGWGAEHWLANAFERAGCTVGRFDYRARRKKFKPWWMIRHELFGINDTFAPDIVLIQRAEKMPASIAKMFSVPVIFWSTEPLVRRRDVDKLLSAEDTFAWVYVHTYTCLDVVRKNFPHLIDRCSVMHNAGALENNPGDSNRTRFAIFNRNVSARRQLWLDEVSDIVDTVQGRYGEPYFADLRDSTVSVNIHFADASVDDFETGIFEALASGCVVVTEKLNPKTVADMGMEDALVQVDSPHELRKALLDLQTNAARIDELRLAGLAAMQHNRWDARAEQMLAKIAEIAPQLTVNTLSQEQKNTIL